MFFLFFVFFLFFLFGTEKHSKSPKWTRNGPEMDQKSPTLTQIDQEFTENGPEMGQKCEKSLKWGKMGQRGTKDAEKKNIVVECHPF